MNELELVPFERAIALARDIAQPLGAERVALEAARGRTLVTALHATDDLVPYARSAMDGYAVRAEDARAGSVLPIAEHVVAGDPIATHRPGTATAIATGAALPLGADSVLRWEDAGASETAVAVRIDVRRGDHLFAPGDDARRGDVLAHAGDALDAGTIALLAAAGHAEVAVRRRPRVHVVCTGDELVPVAATPRPGQIRDSNGPLLRALVQDAGAELAGLTRVGDTSNALHLALRRAVRDADLVITTGGASQGPRDGVKRCLDALGARFAFRSVALRPAKPSALARCAGAIVAVLPGNPSAAFVGYHAFVATVLDGMCGREPFAQTTQAVLAGSIHARADRTYAVHVRVRAECGRLVAEVLDNQCSSLVGNAARANALVLLPPGERVYGDGELVTITLIAPLGAAGGALPHRSVA